MKKSGKSSGQKNKQKLVWWLILLALPLGFLLKESLQYYDVKDRSVAQEKETQLVKDQIVKLEKEKEKLKNADPVTIEKQAREKMKFSKPGEVIYVSSTTD
jgi:cell division protein FtsB